MENQIFVPIGKFAFGAAFFVANFVLRGITISWLWLWFIVPIWGVSPITISQGIGLSFTVGTLTAHLPRHKPDPERDQSFSMLMVGCFIYNGLALFMGWAMHLVLAI